MREPYIFMEGVEMPPKPTRAMPDVEVARDTTIVFNGEPIRLLPTVAHTPGDLSVYFTESHVAHLGDTYLAANPMMYPDPEDPDGFLDRLEAFIDSMDPATIVVGGHEEPADLDAVGRKSPRRARACPWYGTRSTMASRSRPPPIAAPAAFPRSGWASSTDASRSRGPEAHASSKARIRSQVLNPIAMVIQSTPHIVVVPMPVSSASMWASDSSSGRSRMSLLMSRMA